MSGIAGIYSRTGANIPAAAAEALSRGLEQLGPDGDSRISVGDLHFIFRPFNTSTPSEVLAPHQDRDGFILAFAGRLDNLEACRDALGWTPEEKKSACEIIVSLYRRYGIRGFARMVGDFALSLWDPLQEALILATDSLGRHPIYFHTSLTFAIWSCNSRSILAAAGLPLRFDEEYLADYLVNRIPARSPYKGIDILTGGKALVITADRTKVEEYWSLDSRSEIRYSSDLEYEEHFRHLLYQAVQCRLPLQSEVFCELSGGVDSSSIVCAGTSILEKQGKDRLHTVSYIYDQCPSSDETAFINVVEQYLGKAGIHIHEEECPLLSKLQDIPPTDFPTNQLGFLAIFNRLSREMSARGARVLLNGIGGDQLFWSEPPSFLQLADLLAQRKFLELHKQARASTRFLGWPYPMLLWKGIFRPWLRGHIFEDEKSPVGAWFSPEFVRRSAMKERVWGRKRAQSSSLPSRSAQCGLIRRTMRPFALEMAVTSPYVEARHPYLDRRMVEFALAIPLDQKIRLPETRSVVRRALKGIVPDTVRLRANKAGPTEAIYRAIAREWQALSGMCRKLRTAEYGLVDPVRLREALHRSRHGCDAEHSVQLFSTIALELWFRSLEQEDRRRFEPSEEYVQTA